jgi:hypothetical protein
MCKRSGNRRVPLRHRVHQGKQTAPRVTRHAAGTRRTRLRTARRPADDRPTTGLATGQGRPSDGGDGRGAHGTPTVAGTGPAGNSGQQDVATEEATTRRSDAGEKPVEARAPALRPEVAQAHRPGEQLRLRVECRPAVPRHRSERLGGPRLGGTGRARRTNRAPLRSNRRALGGRQLVGHRREQAGVSRAVTPRVPGGPVPAPDGAVDSRRSRGGGTLGRAPSSPGRPDTSRRLVARGLDAHGRRDTDGSARRGHGPVTDQGKTGGLGRVEAAERCWAGPARALPRGRCASEGVLQPAGFLSLREAQCRQVHPGRLLCAAESDAHPDLAGAGDVVPPAQEVAGPPGAALVDLDGLRVAGEHGCTVFHGARHPATVCAETSTDGERARTEG